MPSIGRRGLLASVTGLAGIAGCLTDEPTTPTGSSSPNADAAETEPPTAGRVSLTPADPSEVDGPVTVLPDDLREWIRRAVAEETTVRAHGSGYVYPARQTYEPIPPLTGFDRLRVDDPTREAVGSYDLDAAGGVRYERVVGAEETSRPDGDQATPISALPAARRELALAAIGAESDRGRRVFPETELGSWARTAFFGGYYSHDAAVYRGHEVRQTDAAFSATEVWYVFSLSATEAQSGQRLSLALPDRRGRALVEKVRREHEIVERMERDVAGWDAVAAETLASEHPSLLTHDAVYELTFVR